MSLELGVSHREIEEEMSVAEYKELQMYFKDNAFSSDVNELQMAQLMHMVSSYMGGKTKFHDFRVTAKYKIKNTIKNTIDTANATADDINKFLGIN